MRNKISNFQEKITSLKVKPKKMLRIESFILIVLGIITMVTSIIEKSVELFVLSIVFFSISFCAKKLTSKDIQKIKQNLFTLL